VVAPGDNFHGMTIAEEKGDFSRRLTEAMRKARLDAGPTRFAREFNLRHHGEPVTAQTARKWLYGGALPTQDKLRTLAQWLEVSPHWLRYGEPERAHTTAKQDTATYAVDSAWQGKKFDSLSEPHRKMVLEITRALLRLEGKQ
jgi:transcriptional regulator with XRE-family HTH domain